MSNDSSDIERRRSKVGQLAAAVAISMASLCAQAAPADVVEGHLVEQREYPLHGPMNRPETHLGIIQKDGSWQEIELPESLSKKYGGYGGLVGKRIVARGKKVSRAGKGQVLGLDDLTVDQTKSDLVQGFGGPSIQEPWVAAFGGYTDFNQKVIPPVKGSVPYAILLCRYADITTTPKQLSYYQNFFGTTKPALNHYWQEVSYGNVNLNGSQAFGWFNLPKTRAGYENAALTPTFQKADVVKDCIAAADPTVNFANYTSFAVVVNGDVGAGAGGWGGAWPVTAEGVFSYVAGTLFSTDFNQQYIYVQELGHAFGLPHSSGAYDYPYDSEWDPMSKGAKTLDVSYGSVAPHTIGYHKDRLGWVLPERKTVINLGQQATVNLERLGLPSYITGDGKVLLATIPIQGNAEKYYTVEARRTANSGYDVNIPGDAVVIHPKKISRTTPAHRNQLIR